MFESCVRIMSFREFEMVIRHVYGEYKIGLHTNFWFIGAVYPILKKEPGQTGPSLA